MKKVNCNFSRLTLALAMLGSVMITSCQKDESAEPVIIDPVVPAPVITGTKGVYVLCEGTMGDNNSAISYYDIESGDSEKDYFKKINGRSLGETANDLKAYGSKMYCVLSGIQGKKQSFVEVIDIATGKSLKSISFNSAIDGYMPRYVTFYKNKAYVSRYDGVISRIDTATMAIDGELQLLNGTQKAGGLEGLAAANGKLYVTNSDHPYYGGLKDKVTVIDLEKFTKLKDIAVGYNPVKITAAANGDLLVVSWGNYMDLMPDLRRISSSTDMVTGTYDQNVGPMTSNKNKAYLITDWNSAIKSFDVTTGTVTSDFIKDGTSLNTMYGVNVNAFNENVLITDANYFNSNEGKAYCFTVNGKKKFEFVTAGLPQHAVFAYTYK
ncbi:YncE family protein [Pedobacter nyackensis]|uniref:DNA-binding beta-propeller fold protein YncE n=1 Tax=Pedobacter nyackensis TaxID=475255 RepID=A0A1W2DTA8_9SPHI|nr:DUF5074 domain-containing protein [Pedobacter nyackensis]SMD00647.1 hypothetical protein SAMN04488101_10860 [Pedobacter nyackensis]